MFLVFILLKHRPAVARTSALTMQKQFFFFEVFNNNEVGKVKQYECSISVNNFFQGGRVGVKHTPLPSDRDRVKSCPESKEY